MAVLYQCTLTCCRVVFQTSASVKLGHKNIPDRPLALSPFFNGMWKWLFFEFEGSFESCFGEWGMGTRVRHSRQIMILFLPVLVYEEKRKGGKVLFWLSGIWTFPLKSVWTECFFLSNRNCTHLNNIRQRVSFNSTWHGIAVFFCSRDWEHNLERFLHNRLINLSFLLCCDRSVNWDLFIYSLLSCITHYRTVQCVCVFVLQADSIYGRKTILFCIFLKREKMTGKGREKKTKLN